MIFFSGRMVCPAGKGGHYTVPHSQVMTMRGTEASGSTMDSIARFATTAVLAGAALLAGACASAPSSPRKLGVVYVFHGGDDEASARSSWESTMQMFSYDPNSVVYRNVIWNSAAWPRVLQFGNAPKELGKYAFEHTRIGGRDPANRHTMAHLEALRQSLESRERALGIDFVVDYASWLSADPAHLANPRAIYRPGVPGGAPMTYCGSASDGGLPPDQRWPGCDPERYNVDGTTERLLAAGVSELIVVDLTTSGMRFSKTFDVVNAMRQVVAGFNARTGQRITVRWANDPADLMTKSYPSEPPGWSLSLGAPQRDRHVPLTGHPNPIAEDPRLALLHVGGIEARRAPEVGWEATGVLLINHAIRQHNQSFDPKINDTLTLNRNIKNLLLQRHPSLLPARVLGGWFGRKTENPAIRAQPPLYSRLERTREMRGENLGDAWLYETDDLPSGDMGYLYWSALDELRRAGVRHIIVAFPQIMVDSVLNLVEVPNQIAKEIGYRTWLRHDSGDFRTYPGVGHPFADYWGIWVDRSCPAGASGAVQTVPCCFEMGGCADGRPYPPPRTTPPDEARDDLDPSLAFDVSAYGHLGYDPPRGKPDAAQPVQQQYRGTWTLWQPPNDDPRVGELLADHVVQLLRQPTAEPVAPIAMNPR
jgi:hypothetical protein